MRFPLLANNREKFRRCIGKLLVDFSELVKVRFAKILLANFRRVY